MAKFIPSVIHLPTHLDRKSDARNNYISIVETVFESAFLTVTIIFICRFLVSLQRALPGFYGTLTRTRMKPTRGVSNWSVGGWNRSISGWILDFTADSSSTLFLVFRWELWANILQQYISCSKRRQKCAEIFRKTKRRLRRRLCFHEMLPFFSFLVSYL